MSAAKSFLRFIISKVFLKNLGIAAILTIVIIVLVFSGLHLFTQHGRTRAVPSFYGLDPDAAAEMADDNKLRIEIIDSVYNVDAEKGTVVEQNPLPGKMVKKSRRIFLIINARNREMVIMPDIVGVTHRQAKATLEMTGLEIGRLGYAPDIAVNNVLKQMYKGKEIEPGDTIIKGAHIDLVLGTGLSNRRTGVPDLTGMSFEQAKDRILRASLNMGAVLYDISVINGEDSAAAFVWKQNPEYSEDRKLRLGSPVYIWLSVDSLRLPQPDTLSNNFQDEVPR